MEKGEDKTRGIIGLPQVGIPGMARGVGNESKASIAQRAGSGRAGGSTVLRPVSMSQYRVMGKGKRRSGRVIKKEGKGEGG